MKKIIALILSTCISSTAIAQTPTRFYDTHKEETWEIKGSVSDPKYQAAFQYAYTHKILVADNEVKYFSWNGNYFDAFVYYKHDGRINLQYYQLGEGGASVNSAEKM